MVINEKAKNTPVYLIIVNDEINNRLWKLDFQKFINQGENFFFGSEQNLMHHKFCIIDKIFVISRYYNWTVLAEKSNRENITISNKKEIIKLFYYVLGYFKNYFFDCPVFVNGYNFKLITEIILISLSS